MNLTREPGVHRLPIRLFLLFIGLLPSVAVSQHWEITQIAGSDQGGYFPRISGNRVVWRRHDGNDWEVYLHDGSTVTQLTDNNVDETAPDISGEHIAWYSGEHDDTDIVYDGMIVMEGVANTTDMRLEPGGLLWSAIYPPNRFGIAHVYLYDGTTIKKLSVEGTRHNYNPDMSGENVVWSGFNDGGASAYFYDGTSTVELPQNVGRGQVPRISGNNIVGVGIDPDGMNDQVFLYDGVTNTQLGHTDGRDGRPVIAGQNVAWLSDVNGTREVFVHEEGQAKQLSFDSVQAYAPIVSKSFVVWSANDGDGFEIFVYDGVTTTQLTDNDVDDVVGDISADTIVWTRRGTNLGPEIFVATYVVPEPTTSALALAAMFLLVVGKRRPNRVARGLSLTERQP